MIVIEIDSGKHPPAARKVIPRTASGRFVKFPGKNTGKFVNKVDSSNTTTREKSPKYSSDKTNIQFHSPKMDIIQLTM